MPMDLVLRPWEGAEVGARYYVQSPEALMLGEPNRVVEAVSRSSVWVGTDGVVHVQRLDVRLHQAVKDAVACGALRALVRQCQVAATRDTAPNA